MLWLVPPPRVAATAALAGLLTACSGTHPSPPALAPAATTSTATGRGTLTLQFPTGFRTAKPASAGRKLNSAGTIARPRPAYVNPTASNLLDVYISGALATNLDGITPGDSATVVPTADGTQTLSNVPLYSTTSDVTVVEWNAAHTAVLAVGENTAVAATAGASNTITLAMQMNAVGMAIAEVADGAGATTVYSALNFGIGSAAAATPLYLFPVDPTFGFSSVSGYGGVPANTTVTPAISDGSQFGARQVLGYAVKFASAASTVGLTLNWSNPAGSAVANTANTELNVLFPNPSAYGLDPSLNVSFNLTAQYVGQITEFALPNSSSSPQEILTGPDGNLWFTEFAGNKIGRMTAGGEVVEFAVPTSASQPYGITVGSDHNLWFTESAANQVGRITTGGTITEYNTSAVVYPEDITSGPDNALWFSGYGSANVGRIDASGNFSTFTSGCEPQGIISAGGLIWVAQREESPPGGCSYQSDLGWLTTGGAYNSYSLPYPLTPYRFALGSDGQLYFAQANANQIGSISLTGTNVQAYSAGTAPYWMTSGPDGAIWYVAVDDNAIARMPLPPSGSPPYTEFPAPVGAGPGGLTTGPDGAIWFTEQATGKIARMH